MLDFKQINADHSIFVKVTGINKSIVSTFIDNIKVMGIKKSNYIEKVKFELTADFEIVDISLISFYLELKVERDRARRMLKLSQTTYIDKILIKYYLNQAKSCNILIKEGILLPNKGS